MLDRFNPRARGGRDRQYFYFIPLSILFQSTRPRGARHNESLDRIANAAVSIHAPAGGATCDAECRKGLGVCFNPRARGGRDLDVTGRTDTNHSFNPRARGGRDAARILTMDKRPQFQSTRPRGARLTFFACCRPFGLVSIHAPAGGATTRSASLSVCAVFQSTRPRGARPLQPTYDRCR